jgi:hypothetical protein
MFTVRGVRGGLVTRHGCDVHLEEEQAYAPHLSCATLKAACLLISGASSICCSAGSGTGLRA